MLAVYDWVRSCLSAQSACAFDIYMSPPKVVFSPNVDSSLLDLGMVPAVNLFLSWSENRECKELGSYLSSSLLPQASEMDVAEGKGSIPPPDITVASRSSAAVFPVGTPLVPKKGTATASSSASAKSRGLDDAAMADSKSASSGGEKKPRWFKL